MDKLRRYAFACVAIGFSVFQLYMATLGQLDPFLFRIIHLYFALVLTFIALKKKQVESRRERITNYLLLLCTAGTGLYLVLMWSTLVARFPLIEPLPGGGMIFGMLFFVVLLVALSRHAGLELVYVVAVIILYVLFGNWLPGIFHHSGYSIANIIDVGYLSTEGTFGETLGLSANYLFLFILFGAFLLRTGAGELIIACGRSVAGHLTGGAGKIATIACAGIGSISGSAVAGVATVGSITIPLMRSNGYPAYLAGAVIAAAASGDIIIPPVMGAIAFLMAQYLGMPYGKIIGYAIVPALMYFFSIFCAVHFDAKKRGFPRIPRKELPSALPVIKQKWHLSIPVLVLVYLLVKQHSLSFSVLIPLYVLMGMMLVFSRAGLKSRGRDLLETLRDGARNALLVVVSLAVANLIEGLISITGLSLKISTVLVRVSPNVYVLLALAAATLFVLGLALPSFVIYITSVPILAPPMIQFGLDPVAVHFFLVYWALLSMVTPPTGVSFYAAAGVAEAPVMKVGWAATRICAPVYLLTFFLVLHPAILLRGSNLWETLYFLLAAVFGIICISSANSGYLLRLMGVPERVLLIVAGVFLIYAQPFSFAFGTCLLAGVMAKQLATSRRAAIALG